MNRWVGISGLGIIAAFCGLAQAAVVNMNYSDAYNTSQNLNGTPWSATVAPLSYAGSTWNGSKYAYSGDDSGNPLNNLLDSEGNASGVGFTMSGFTACAADWTSAVPVMLQGGFWTDGAGMTLTLKGLNTNGVYDLYLAGNAVNAHSSTFTIGGVSKATSASSNSSWVLNDNYVQFTNLTPDAQGEIVVGITAGPQGVRVLNGFQLASVPEPAALGMIGLAGLALLRRRA